MKALRVRRLAPMRLRKAPSKDPTLYPLQNASPLADLCCDLVFLFTGSNHPQRLVRQRPLQLERLFDGCRQPGLALHLARQDYWHCLCVDRADHIVRLAGEKRIEQVLPAFPFSIASPWPPDPSEEEE